MKLCGLVRKLRSSQPLQPMNVKIKLHYNPFVDINVKMDYYEWTQYLHDEIRKYEYKTSTKYWCSGDGIYTGVFGIKVK